MPTVYFAQPVMLLGALAALIPLVIHLALRPRPRRVRFPALALLRPALVAGNRARRVRNVALLLLRCLLLAATAFLLAGPTCDPDSALRDRVSSVAAVLIVDDSWSTDYLCSDGRTVFDHILETAEGLARDSTARPPPSEIGLIWADPRRPEVPLSADPASVRDALWRAGGAQRTAAEPPRAHAATLRTAVERARRWLDDARQERREIVILTDGAAHAFRDVRGEGLSAESAAVRVISLEPEPRTNLAILDVRGPQAAIAESLDLGVEATLVADGLSSTATLQAYAYDRAAAGGPASWPVSSRLVLRTDPQALSADEPFTLGLEIPPMGGGPLPAGRGSYGDGLWGGLYGLSFVLAPDDRLPYDQQRYLAVQTTPPPHIWLVTPAVGQVSNLPSEWSADLSSLILQTLLDPPTLPEGRRAVRLRVLTAEEFADLADRHLANEPRAEASGPQLCILTSGVTLSAAARQSLHRLVEAGTTLLLVPGSERDPRDWPGVRPWLLRSPPAAEQPPADVGNIAWSESSRFAGRTDGIEELAACTALRRLRLVDLTPQTRVEARFGDGEPAIVSLPLGRGRVYLLATGPDPRDSDLGIRAAGLLAWLHALASPGVSDTGRAADHAPPFANVTVGDSIEPLLAAFACGPDPRAGLVTINHGARLQPAILHTPVAPRDATARPGLVWITTGAGHPCALLAVNWPPEESDLTPIDEAALAAQLGGHDVTLERLAAGHAPFGERPRFGWTPWRDPAEIWPLLLLAALLLELFIANRRRAAPSQPPPAPPQPAASSVL